MNLLNNIEAIFSTLSRQERKVALKVLQNPQEVQSMNITKLAKKRVLVMLLSLALCVEWNVLIFMILN